MRGWIWDRCPIIYELKLALPNQHPLYAAINVRSSTSLRTDTSIIRLFFAGARTKTDEPTPNLLIAVEERLFGAT